MADLLCAACMADTPSIQDAAWRSRWAITIYRGNALCPEHYVEIRNKEQEAPKRYDVPTT